MKNSTLDDLAAIVGFSATVRLAAHYGGRDLTLPLEISDKSPIAKLVGISALQRLHDNWAGQRIAVPTLTVIEVEIRNSKILWNLRNGKTVGTIAKLVGLSERRVQQIRVAFEADGLLPLIFAHEVDQIDPQQPASDPLAG